MSITVQEQVGSFKISDKGREYTRNFIIRSTTALDPFTAASSAGINLCDYYQYATGFYDLLSFAKSASCDPQDTQGKIWRLSVSYGGTENQEPEDRPPEISWSNANFQKVLEYDQDGAVLANTAGDIIRDIGIDDARPTINYSFYSSSWNPAINYVYRNAVNNDTFTIDGFTVPAANAKIASISTNREYFDDGSGQYALDKVTISISFNPDGWRGKFLNAGLNQKKSGKTERITTDDGTPITEPFPLKENGEKLDPNGTPYYLEDKKLYPELDLSVFSL